MLKMQQLFGANIIINKQENASSSYVVFFKKLVKRDSKILLFNKIKDLVGNSLWTNENIDYIVVQLNIKQKLLIQKDSSISFIGAVNIDSNKLISLMKGDISNIL